jgi:hypothetical protein
MGEGEIGREVIPPRFVPGETPGRTGMFHGLFEVSSKEPDLASGHDGECIMWRNG